MMKDFFKKDECSKFYKLGHTLGKGSFARVRSAIHRQDGSHWAVKCIDKSSLALDDEDYEDALKVEVDILQMVNHVNIVRLKEVFDDDKMFYMVMEEMSGGALFDRIIEKEKYTEGEARDVVYTLTVALKYCHGMGIVHRDLKPENLLYESRAPDALLKIADFGLAKLLKEKCTTQTSCGTPEYVAPEILEEKVYDKAVDIWSLGVITYILLCGFPPFYDENISALYASIKSGSFNYPSPYWDCVSEQARELVSKMLVVDPTKRFTASDVLAHPWIKKCSAATVELPLVNGEMRQYNIRRRFRASVNVIGFINSVGHGTR